MNLPLRAALAATILPAVVHAAGVFNVRDFGASGDGRTKDTAAIQRAVEAAAQSGGGTVDLPAGHYLSGSIHLENDLTLNLEAGAVLLYSPDPADSPLVPSRWEDTTAYTYGPLIYANGKQNLAITGRGVINGQGEKWWWRAGRPAPGYPGDPAAAREHMLAWRQLEARINDGYEPKEADFAIAAQALRPCLVETVNCRNVRVEGVTLTDSPFWNLHPLYSENIVVEGVSFVSWGPNGDGVDVDSCRNVRISDCFFRTGDDCIVLKSGRDAEGRRIHRPTEFVTITNCVMYEGHGAVVIGSETSGDVRDIVASNIVAKGTDCGIRIKSMRGRGGVVENVRCDNFVIEDAGNEGRPHAGTKCAVEITLLYGPSKPEPLSVRTPLFRNFAFSNLTIVGATQVASIHGLPEKSIDGLRFTDIRASGVRGFDCDHVDDVELHDVRVDATKGSAFSFAQARNLTLDDVTSYPPGAAKAVRLPEEQGADLAGETHFAP